MRNEAPNWKAIAEQLAEAQIASQRVRDIIRSLGIKRDDPQLYSAIMYADAKNHAALTLFQQASDKNRR
jgi:hypothetical protein